MTAVFDFFVFEIKKEKKNYNKISEYLNNLIKKITSIIVLVSKLTNLEATFVFNCLYFCKLFIQAPQLQRALD